MSGCKRLGVLLICLIYLLPSCSQATESTFYYSGDGRELLIQQNELPPDWEKYTELDLSREGHTTWIARYSTLPIETYFNTTIDVGSVITVFQQHQKAVDDFGVIHEANRRRVEENLERLAPIGLAPEQLDPPQRYHYQSEIADEFEITYYPTEVLVGHHYEVQARYGNVIAELSAVVADPEEIASSNLPETANMLTWEEVEALLRRLDEKFLEAGVAIP